MVEAATEFRKNGFNDSDAATLAKTATVFQNVSDEAISAGESASFIISQMIAFGIEAENAQSIIDKVNEVANRFSVSSGDLSKALGIVASTSSAMGNSIDQTLGVVTAITEQTRNASKSARAANTIFSRLAQIVDENSETGQKLIKIYNGLGIALYDSSGQMRSTYDILADLASQWGSLDKNTQQYIAITSAGTNQLNNFLALMNNFDHATQATATAIDSVGSAMRENEAFQDSLEYQTNNLKATFQDLANNVIDKELISSVLKLGDAFLKLANTDIGVLVTKIGLLAGAGWGLSSLVQVSKIIPVIVGQFKNFGAVLSIVAKGSGTFGAALSAAGGAGAVALPIFLAVSAAIVGIVEAIKAYKESHPDFDTAAQSVSTLSDSLKTAQDRLNEINKLDWKDRTRAINEEEEAVKALVEQQKQELRLAQIRQAMAADKELSERTGYGEAVRYHVISPRDVDDQTFTSMDEAVKSLSETEGITGESTDELKQKLLDLGYAFVTTTEHTKLTADEMNALDTQALQELSGSIKENGELNTYLKDSYQGLYEELAPTYEKLVNLEIAQKNAIPGARELTDSERELKGAFEQLIGTMLSFESSGDNAYQTIANLTNILGVTPSYARDLAVSMGLVNSNVRYVYDGIVQLEDGTWKAKDGLGQVADSMERLGIAAEDAAVKQDAVVQKATSVADSIVGEVTAVDTANQAFVDLVAQEIIFNNNDLDVSQKLTALAQLAQQAGYTAQAIASIQGGTAAQYVNEDQIKGYMRTHGVDRATAENALLAEVWKAGSAGQQVTRDVTDKAVTRGGGSAKKSIDETAEYAEKKAKEAAEKAAQEAEQAAKEAAEKAKEQINKTFDALKESEEAYWDAKIDALETQNKLIDRQTRLEEKLKALQEAKQKKILLYKDGRFQYSEDVGAIASAQQDYNETWRDIYVEEQTEILNDLKDKALAIIEEYRDKALENGELTQENINSLLSEYHELGNNTYQTVAYGVENITNIVASGVSALTGSVSNATSTATSVISGTMGAIGSSMSKMATGLTSAASLLNKQFGEGLSAILKTSQAKSGKMVGTYQLGENEQTLDDFRNEYWGDTSGKFSKLSLLYGGGQAWWLGMMSKYLEDPEKNANLKLGSMTLKELYDTDWTKKVGSASSLGEIDDYIAREQAKYILNGGSQSDYEALNKIAQDAYRELYFRNPRAYAPGAKGYGGYDPEFSAAQYAVDAALRYSGSNYDVFGVEGARTSGMSAGRVSDLNFLRELVSQGERAGASSVSQTQAEWAKNQLNERYQTSYKNTLDAIDKQIEENSKKWYTADAEERNRLHLLNEELRKNRGEYEKKVGGNANGTLSWRGGLSVVGEKGPELRVLNKGDGIIPSNITENLWKIGSDPSKFMRDVVRTTSNMFNISSLSLPNARDAQSLVDGLQELAHQYVTKRK